MPPTKIPFRELTKGQISSEAVKVLTLQGARVRPVANMPFKFRKKRVEPGWPDIQGYTRTGVVLLCEVKTINDYLSYEQIQRLTDCLNCGGLALIATQNKTTGAFELRDFAID